jgi:hypothetical protein
MFNLSPKRNFVFERLRWKAIDDALPPAETASTMGLAAHSDVFSSRIRKGLEPICKRDKSNWSESVEPSYIPSADG